IPVFNAPYQHFHSAAEMVISYLILLSRQVGDRSREIHSGEWNKTATNCNEVRGKTLGIVGYGHVGSQIGVMAEALSLRVIFYDTVSLMPIGRAQPVDTLDELLERSDYVALNVSNLAENVGMIDRPQLEKMKKGSYLINVSYNEAVSSQDMPEGGREGSVYPSHIDPNPPFHLTLGDETLEARTRVGEEVTTSLIKYLTDGTTHGAVNFPSIAPGPLKPGFRRLLNIHKNVRGVLQEIDYILSAYNVGKQVLDTKDGIGYLIADVSTEHLATEIVTDLAQLANSIRTRIV
ncbi:hypothetical protein BDK51DRAFT_17722, partial [Blyttiomyces helicus]